jgi:hypothetical protein
MIKALQTIPDGDGEIFARLEAGGRVYPQAAREALEVAKRETPLRGAETSKGLAERIREQFHVSFKMDVDW